MVRSRFAEEATIVSARHPVARPLEEGAELEEETP
jgi:hypothetical protein